MLNQDDISIQGLPDTIFPGIEVTLTCTVNRIEPEAQLVWQLQLQDEMLGSTVTKQNSDGTYKKRNNITVV